MGVKKCLTGDIYNKLPVITVKTFKKCISPIITLIRFTTSAKVITLNSLTDCSEVLTFVTYLLY